MLAVGNIKKCASCKVWKDVAGFYGDKNCKDGLGSHCKSCNTANKRNGYKKNRTKLIARASDWKRRNRDRVRANDVRAIYGLIPEEHTRMLAAQGGNCAVCKSPSQRGRLCVDHDHVTGKVRSLLCRQCNLALGLLKENSERIYKLAEYAASHGPLIVLETR